MSFLRLTEQRQRKLPSTVDVKVLINQGYRRVSRKHGLVARIDRHDWRKIVAAACKVSEGDVYKAQKGVYQDFYRRVLSHDKIYLRRIHSELIPPSDGDEVGYVEIHHG